MIRVLPARRTSFSLENAAIRPGDDEADFGVGDFGGDVEAYLSWPDDALPAGAGAIDGEVLGFDAGGDLNMPEALHSFGPFG